MDLRLSPDDRIESGTKRASAAKPQKQARTRAEKRAPKPRKTKSDKPRRRRSGFGGFMVSIIYFGFYMTILGALAAGGIVFYYGSDLGSSDTWEVPQRPPNIRVLASNGQLLSNRGQTGGEAIAYHELPYYVPQAVIASEDRRFMHHFGVDPVGLIAVGVESMRAGRVTRGASTITQQVAKNLFLTPDQTLGRKVQEALLALWLEQHYTKEQILELYINRVHFGSGATGIEAAAQTYFGVSARNLSLGQAAMLAGILPAPASYNPRNHPERALERQALALANMVREGFITQQEADAATLDPARNTATAQRVAGAEYYVADWVETLMTAYLGEVHDDVVVQTTLDWDLQKHAEFVVREALRQHGETRNFSQAALVAMDTDGRVRAMIGGVDYSMSQYNRAVTARRQPGSAFKPFVYLAALQQGYTPDTLMVDEPLDHNGWRPQNSNNRYVGPVLLRDALAYSINTVAARLAIDIGPENVVETAYRLGFTSNFMAVPAIALGTQEVSLLDLTAAYAPFSNGGYGVIANVITRITTVDGEVLFEAGQSGPGKILTDQQVGMMNDMLKAGVEAGTGRGAQLGGWPMAGKTGTSQRSRDALFVGYTAHMVGGVWLGNDDDSPTSGMAGGSVPAQIWREFMTEAHRGLTVANLPGNYTRLVDWTANSSAEGQQWDGPLPTELPVDQNQQVLQQPAPPQQGTRDAGAVGDLLNSIFGN